MKFATAALLASSLAAISHVSLSKAEMMSDGGLPRRSLWGAVLVPQPGQVAIQRVVPGGTAAAVGLNAGDKVLSLNGKPIAKPLDFVSALRALPPGSTVRLTVARGASTVRLAGKAAAAPHESYAGARVTYGAVPFENGQLRSIMVEPSGVEKPPVVFMIQGFTCSTIEALQPNGEFANLAAGFSKAGIAFFRMEKPGVGDSSGTTSCADIDLTTELDAFRAGYKALIRSGYDPSRIIILGHSLGGIEGPVLASEVSPRGIIVYGTVLRNWADYTQDLDRVQDFVATGEDPVEEYNRAELDRRPIHEFFFENRSIADIVQRHPEAKAGVTALFAWDGGSKAYGRNENFVRGISKLNLPSAWRRTRSNVLSLYGASDIVALTGEDQQTIADLVNHYRPGTAEYVEVPETMHLMDLVGDRNAYRRANRAAGTFTSGPFNPKVLHIMIEWVQRTMTRPPVVADGNGDQARAIERQ